MLQSTSAIIVLPMTVCMDVVRDHASDRNYAAVQQGRGIVGVTGHECRATVGRAEALAGEFTIYEVYQDVAWARIKRASTSKQVVIKDTEGNHAGSLGPDVKRCRRGLDQAPDQFEIPLLMIVRRTRETGADFACIAMMILPAENTILP
ncbi:hypothetical protein [Modicisalibacter xianhensis]|uniref:hypothetical protein n=1 Tax=Modicisalibacter xianhensis TaxID=442341 RepID=UPI000B86E269|nr:hypothetical protein [Halomonas xianhensis]